MKKVRGTAKSKVGAAGKKVRMNVSRAYRIMNWSCMKRRQCCECFLFQIKNFSNSSEYIWFSYLYGAFLSLWSR